MEIDSHVDGVLMGVSETDFADTFLAAYLERGFGALPKREIDLLVFDLLCQMDHYAGKSNYELSTLLKIPESRVKTLRLSSALKYQTLEPGAILAKIAGRLTEGGQIPALVNGKIEISLEDPIEHREMVHFLKGLGRHAEFTFNSEVVRVSPSSLFELILDHIDTASSAFDSIIRDAVKDEEEAGQILSDSMTKKSKFAQWVNENATPEVKMTILVMGAQVLKQAFS